MELDRSARHVIKRSSVARRLASDDGAMPQESWGGRSGGSYGSWVRLIGMDISPSSARPAPPTVGEPVPGTPLETLHGTLPNRILNALLRAAYTTVEEVEAAADSELLGIHTLGWPSVTSIRDVIAESQIDMRHTGDITEVVLDGAQVRELAILLATLAAYADARQQRDKSDRAKAFLEALLGSEAAGP